MLWIHQRQQLLLSIAKPTTKLLHIQCFSWNSTSWSCLVSSYSRRVSSSINRPNTSTVYGTCSCSSSRTTRKHCSSREISTKSFCPLFTSIRIRPGPSNKFASKRECLCAGLVWFKSIERCLTLVWTLFVPFSSAKTISRTESSSNSTWTAHRTVRFQQLIYRLCTGTDRSLIFFLTRRESLVDAFEASRNNSSDRWSTGRRHHQLLQKSFPPTRQAERTTSQFLWQPSAPTDSRTKEVFATFDRRISSGRAELDELDNFLVKEIRLERKLRLEESFRQQKLESVDGQQRTELYFILDSSRFDERKTFLIRRSHLFSFPMSGQQHAVQTTRTRTRDGKFLTTISTVQLNSSQNGDDVHSADTEPVNDEPNDLYRFGENKVPSNKRISSLESFKNKLLIIENDRINVERQSTWSNSSLTENLSPRQFSKLLLSVSPRVRPLSTIKSIE